VLRRRVLVCLPQLPVLASLSVMSRALSRLAPSVLMSHVSLDLVCRVSRESCVSRVSRESCAAYTSDESDTSDIATLIL